MCGINDNYIIIYKHYVCIRSMYSSYVESKKNTSKIN